MSIIVGFTRTHIRVSDWLTGILSCPTGSLLVSFSCVGVYIYLHKDIYGLTLCQAH